MKEVLTLAQELIARPSVTPHDAGCQTVIAERLTALGFQCEPMPSETASNLWARLGDKKPLLVFAGHTDVVPTGPLPQWSSPPFEPVIRNGNLYGRGTSDMKAAIAAMIIAVEKFLRSHNFSGSIGFLLTSDEEGSGQNGTVKVMENLLKRKEKIDYCIVGEPSSNIQVGDRIRIGRRGSLHGKITIYGKQGHVAYPEVADNPIHKSMFALHELTHVKWDEGNEFYPPTSFQISNIFSGDGITPNIIPGQMEVLCNFRFSTAVTPLELQERCEAILKKHGLKNKSSWKTTAEPFLSQKGNLLSAAREAIFAITNLNVELSTGGGTSDGRFIAKTGAEVIEIGMTNATAHQVDEHIELTDLMTLQNIYNKILHIVNKV